ncbi:Uncharacterised protein [Vibrio cholerae]|nr:Uncharacterised protein [Vibrio cholerae]CSB84114.1 Uncharacterised protein [Vibrio cholerae]CSI02983.1 Uncharacterised protein [Vibrio cholerae]
MGANHNFAACHAFTDIVVGITGEIQLKTTCVPDSERLPCGTIEDDLDGRGGDAEIAVTFRDFTRETRANRTVGVDHVVIELQRLLVFHGC